MATALATLGTLDRDIVAETYVDMERLIHATVWQFVRKHGGDVEELFSEAQMHFMECCQAWREGRNNSEDLAVEVRRWVWFGLFDTHRTRTGHRRKVKRKMVTEGIELVADYRGQGFDIVALCDQLSEDAAVVARLTLETPAELARVADAKGGEPRNLRSTIRAYLAGLGWAADRINESFDEIRRAL